MILEERAVYYSSGMSVHYGLQEWDCGNVVLGITSGNILVKYLRQITLIKCSNTEAFGLLPYRFGEIINATGYPADNNVRIIKKTINFDNADDSMS